MNTRLTLLTAACALALVACGDKSANTPTTGDTASPAPAAQPTVDPAATPTPTPVETATPTPVATTPPVSDKPAPVVMNCAKEIASNDAMQYDVGSITVPASCTEFKITLKHTGQMPVAAMGHNVVITTAADMPAVTADGMGAGLDNDYIKSGDARVIAHTKLIGGGETTSVSFPVSKIQGNGPYAFFCSFPGHSALMKGTIAVK